MTEEKNAEVTIEELERLLDKQEADLVILRDERNKTIRRLKKAK